MKFGLFAFIALIAAEPVVSVKNESDEITVSNLRRSNNNGRSSLINSGSTAGDEAIQFYSKEGPLQFVGNRIRNTIKLAAPHHKSESRRLVAVDDETVYDGLFPCDCRGSQFYTINLEAGVKYRIETIRDPTECALDTVGWLYKGVCNSSSGFSSCTKIVEDYGSRPACGPCGDACIEYIPTTSGPYTIRVGKQTRTSLSCPTADGYNYQVKVTVVSLPLNCSTGQSEVVVTIRPDVYPRNISWDIVNTGTTTEVASEARGGLTQFGGHNWIYCFPGGDYTFTIYDSYGDGFRWGSDPKFFSITVDGIEKLLRFWIFYIRRLHSANRFAANISETILINLFNDLATITKDSIRAALLTEGVVVDVDNIDISSVVTNSVRKLLDTKSRLLQGTSSVHQDVNVNAPSSAINTGTMTTNINNAIITASSGNNNL